ncbi:hypothetical protein C8Q80DRAFT_793178 [Daedaleopsis nitida]|nr:hypothetical protein C8Q80DRAFT_793178 [Daedaleopsis nitida]
MIPRPCSFWSVVFVTRLRSCGELTSEVARLQTRSLGSWTHYTHFHLAHCVSVCCDYFGDFTALLDPTWSVIPLFVLARYKS